MTGWSREPRSQPSVHDIHRCPELGNREFKTSTRVAERLTAAKIILDRVMGKATQPIVADVHQEDEPMTLDEMFDMALEIVETAGLGRKKPE